MLSIRPAVVADAAVLKTFITELAEYEKLSHEVVVSAEDLVRDGFSGAPKFRAFLAEWEGVVAGYALVFPVYSTFEGREGMFLEDLFVRPQFRGKGIGKALLAHVAALAREEKCYGLCWEVLHWNQPAIEFYQKLGAVFLTEWKKMLLAGGALESVANG